MTLSLLDTTVLSNFAHAQRPDLIQLALGSQAAVTPAVHAELRQGETLGLAPRVDWRWLPVLSLTAVEQILSVQYQVVVDAGEAECLAVAVTRHGRFLSDDLAARRLAQANQLIVSGTLGLLLRLIQQKQIALPAAEAVLAQMRQAGYRAPSVSLQSYLA